MILHSRKLFTPVYIKQNVQLHTEFFLRGPRQGAALRVTPVPSVCLSVP